MDYDAIVIGAGHNGLASAIMLADKGWKVLVLEKGTEPGGAAKTGQVTIPGFQHDLFSMNIKLFLNSRFYKKHQDEMHEYGFEPVISDKPYACVFPDGTGIAAHQNRKKMFKSIARHSANDTYAWNDLDHLYDQVAPHLLSLMQTEIPSIQSGKVLMKAFKELKLKRSLEVGSQLLKSPRQFVDSWFENDKVKALFFPWGYQMDFGPDISAGAAFPLIEAIDSFRHGTPFSKGGVNKIIKAMVKMLEARGGHLQTNQQVDEVIIEGKTAKGVRLANGETIYAKKAVIGNVTPTQLVNQLIDKHKLPDSYFEKANDFHYGPGTMMIHLALDEPLEWKAGEEFSESAYVHIGPYTEDLARTHVQAMNGILPDSPFLMVGQPDTIDQTRSPEGKATIWLMVRVLPAHPKGDALGKINSSSWDEMKEQYADRIIDKLAEYTTGTKEKILARTVFSPEDLQTENPNLVGGDLMAGSMQMFQNFVFRPVAGYSRYHTPVKNLYMIGASTWPGGGLNAASGYLLGEKLG
ncbi:phytoene desaturase family protein [Sediminibacillus massiliensis]|uniref:phytoene desaturase family protein n=1 Tax=Sediminibacillus massiliensis TaxID=1926277 RepID=UPI0009885AAF|nr:NAD(P)/FAD-dependent oxidoreductase [Sediminibacillus massiliensis]